jgi:hypothetical protein
MRQELLGQIENPPLHAKVIGVRLPRMPQLAKSLNVGELGQIPISRSKTPLLQSLTPTSWST